MKHKILQYWNLGSIVCGVVLMSSKLVLFNVSVSFLVTAANVGKDYYKTSTTFFFSIMMMFTRNKTTKNTCNKAPTTVYCAVGEKSKFKMLNSNNN